MKENDYLIHKMSSSKFKTTLCRTSVTILDSIELLQVTSSFHRPLLSSWKDHSCTHRLECE